MSRLIAVCIFLAVQCEAGTRPRLGLEFPRFSYWYGETEYQIAFVEGGRSGKSILEFPVNNLRLGGRGTVYLSRRFSFSLGGWGSIDRDAGTFRDTDLEMGRRSVWSQTDAELEAWGLECEGTFWGLEGDCFWLGPGVRVEYDRLEYDCRNVKQRGEIPYEAPGPALTYRQQRLSFFPGVSAALKPCGWFRAGFFASGSPLNYMWDRDDHVLRSKVSEGECWAWGFLSSLQVDFVFGKRLQAGLWASYRYLDSFSGVQEQWWYGGSNKGDRISDIEYSASRETLMVGARLEVRF